MDNELRLPKRIRNHVNPLAIFHENEIKVFNNKRPVIMDIGSYRGEFAQGMLKNYGQERNFVFFEIRKPFYKYLKELFKNDENVRIFDGDAGRSLKKIILALKENGNEIDKIFINFPDPWFKEKHKKRRFLNEKILKEFSEVLGENSQIIFQTDQKHLFKDTIKVIKNNTNFKIKKFKNSLLGIQTYWEELKIKEGSKIFRMSLQKKDLTKKWWNIF